MLLFLYNNANVAESFIFNNQMNLTGERKTMFGIMLICDMSMKLCIWYIAFTSSAVFEKLTLCSRFKQNNTKIFVWLLVATLINEASKLSSSVLFSKLMLLEFWENPEIFGLLKFQTERVFAVAVRIVVLNCVQVFTPAILILGYSILIEEEMNTLCEAISDSTSHSNEIFDSVGFNSIKEKFVKIADTIVTVNETHKYYTLICLLSTGTFIAFTLYYQIAICISFGDNLLEYVWYLLSLFFLCVGGQKISQSVSTFLPQNTLFSLVHVFGRQKSKYGLQKFTEHSCRCLLRKIVLSDLPAGILVQG